MRSSKKRMWTEDKRGQRQHFGKYPPLISRRRKSCGGDYIGAICKERMRRVGSEQKRELQEVVSREGQQDEHWSEAIDLSSYWSVVTLPKMCIIKQWNQNQLSNGERRYKGRKVRQLLFCQNFNLWKNCGEEYIPWRSSSVWGGFPYFSFLHFFPFF